MRALWYALALMAMVVIATRVSALRQLLRLRLRGHRVERTEPESTDPELRRLIEEGVAPWRVLGFVERGWCAVTGADAHEPDATRGLALEHPEHRVWGVAMPSPYPEPGCEIIFGLQSFVGADQVVTVDGSRHLIIGGLPETTIGDPYALDPARQLEAHLAAMSGGGEPAALASLDEYRERSNAFSTRYPEHLEGLGLARRDAHGVCRLRPGAAWRAIGDFRRGRSRLVAAQLARRKRAGGQRPVDPVIDAEAFRRAEASRQARGTGGFSMLIFLATLVVAVASFTTWFRDPATIVLLIAVLLAHELGHFLAMRAFGYQDTGIFFMPFLGAAATGRKRDATVTQQVIVLLMGPLPGLALGMAVLLCDPLRDLLPRGRLVGQTVMMLIALNWFNLLPLVPFDGGRVVQRLLFARHPWLDVVFTLLGAGGLIALSLSMGMTILAWVGIFLALGVGAHARRARLLGILRRRPEWSAPADDASRLRAIFATMAVGQRRSPFFAQRLALARGLRDTLNEPRPRLIETVVLLAVYLVALLGPLTWWGIRSGWFDAWV